MIHEQILRHIYSRLDIVDYFIHSIFGYFFEEKFYEKNICVHLMELDSLSFFLKIFYGPIHSFVRIGCVVQVKRCFSFFSHQAKSAFWCVGRMRAPQTAICTPIK